MTADYPRPAGAESGQAVVSRATRDLGDVFLVQRALPSAQHQMVARFALFGQIGPPAPTQGEGLDCLFPANCCDKPPRAARISMLAKINTLPGTQCELALAYWNR